jgi:class 3 adenylate cyclase
MKKFWLFFVCFFLFIAQTIWAQSPQVLRIWEVAQGVSWTKFDKGKFIIAIMENKSLAKEFEAFVKDKKIAGKEIEIYRFNSVTSFNLYPTNVLFVDGNSNRNNSVLEMVGTAMKKGFPTLFITAKAGMLAEGSHVNLINNGAQCEINLPEVQKMGLSMGNVPNAIIKSEKVKGFSTNNTDIKGAIKETIKEIAGDKNEANKSTTRRGGGEKEVMESSASDDLLSKAATEKAITDKQADAYKAYVRELEKLLDENKIDYQTLKQRYENERETAEKEIKMLNLTLIQHDSLNKKNILIKEQQLALVNADARTNFYIALAATIFAILGIALAILTYRDRQIIAKEKQKSEALLLSILPAETAQELKEKGTATPKRYDLATVLFSDFKGFTNIAEGMSPEDLVKELDKCFLAFDEIAEKYGLERIKTIGDAYMCAGGLPTANKTNPVDAVKAGIDMQNFMAHLKKQREAEGKPYFECRLGIHSGKVVAGVVGKKKFAYDIWGDTVNIASRMESSGEVGRINLSADTYNLVKDHFKCEYRGKVNAKGKGDVDMYFVNEAVA